MADLSTTYMGLNLKNPVVVAACPVSNMVDRIKRVEDAGAGALVIKSLFEEQIMLEAAKMEKEKGVGSESFGESISYFADIEHAGASEHLMWVEKSRKAVQMPLIGSLNAINRGNWATYAKQMESSGVDGIELNIYAVQTNLDKCAADIEKEHCEIVEEVKGAVSLPVAVKLSPYYTSVANVAAELDQRGADALVLFNRFLQPDIDIRTEALRNMMDLSEPIETKLALRWISILHGRVKADLVASTGIHDAEAVVKHLLAGAAGAQMASAILRNGVEYISTVLEGVEKWMDEKGYKAIDEFRGKVSQKEAANPFAFERAQYVDLLIRSS